jgi:hypothetical protein
MRRYKVFPLALAQVWSVLHEYGQPTIMDWYYGRKCIRREVYCHLDMLQFKLHAGREELLGYINDLEAAGYFLSGEKFIDFIKVESAPPDWIVGCLFKEPQDSLWFRQTCLQRIEDAKPKPKVKRPCVYLMSSNTGLYKIGKTTNIDKRLYDFTTLPLGIALVRHWEVDNYDNLESELHSYFRDKRDDGEWFRLTEDDVAFLNSYRNGDELYKPISSVTSERLRKHFEDTYGDRIKTDQMLIAIDNHMNR